MDAVELAMQEWEAGYRWLQEVRSRPGGRPAVDAAVLAAGDELRRRLGSTFTLAELADLYAQGTDWALGLAMGADDPAALDARVADAAFYIYMREAADYPRRDARRLPPRPPRGGR